MVQAMLSSQLPLMLVWAHPVATLQTSAVHTLASSQLRGEPATQAPPAHVSFVVQEFPSSHAFPVPPAHGSRMTPMFNLKLVPGAKSNQVVTGIGKP
jgi:hypothetical protein